MQFSAVPQSEMSAPAECVPVDRSKNGRALRLTRGMRVSGGRPPPEPVERRSAAWDRMAAAAAVAEDGLNRIVRTCGWRQGAIKGAAQASLAAIRGQPRLTKAVFDGLSAAVASQSNALVEIALDTFNQLLAKNAVISVHDISIDSPTDLVTVDEVCRSALRVPLRVAHVVPTAGAVRRASCHCNGEQHGEEPWPEGSCARYRQRAARPIADVPTATGCPDGRVVDNKSNASGLRCRLRPHVLRRVRAERQRAEPGDGVSDVDADPDYDGRPVRNVSGEAGG